MITLDPQQQVARDWFESLRDRICAAFEAIEAEAGSHAKFDYLPWDRETEDGSEGGGGVRGVMKGKVFEKVGVNVSTVQGTFAPEFARTMHGADENPGFTAAGISLVAHMANPHVPAVHMNTRFLTTGKAWFGGGADLTPTAQPGLAASTGPVRSSSAKATASLICRPKRQSSLKPFSTLPRCQSSSPALLWQCSPERGKSLSMPKFKNMFLNFRASITRSR